MDVVGDPALKDVVSTFTKLYAGNPARTWLNTRWLGVSVLQTPLDLWIMQEIVYETRPDLIVKTGTFQGGKALFLAAVCDQMASGQIVTIDTEDQEGKPAHPRIKYLLGSSVPEEIVAQVRDMARKSSRVMVLLDSDHTADHVLSELRLYGEMVTKGCYLVVEDTAWEVVMPDFGSGSGRAVEMFLAENSNFVVDQEREKFFMTAHPGGYLRRDR